MTVSSANSTSCAVMGGAPKKGLRSLRRAVTSSIRAEKTSMNKNGNDKVHPCLIPDRCWNQSLRDPSTSAQTAGFANEAVITPTMWEGTLYLWRTLAMASGLMRSKAVSQPMKIRRRTLEGLSSTKSM
eukprot:15482634-Alexandrium_andersonii.AAC.2